MHRTVSVILMAVFLSLLSFFFDGGFIYMAGDDANAITSIEKKYSPELYENDPQVLSMMNSYFTVYYEALYGLEKLFGTKTACAVFQFLSRFLLYSSLLFLGHSLFKSLGPGLLASLMFLSHKIVLAGGTVTGNSLHPQYMALGILLYGLAFLFRGNMLISGIIIAASVYVHATTAIWGTAIAFFCWLAVGGFRDLKKSALAALAAIVILAPFAFLYFSMFRPDAAPFDIKLAESLSRWRLGIHVFPSQWPLQHILLKSAVFAGMLFFGFVGIRDDVRLKRILAALLLGMLFLMALGFFMSEIHYTPLINKLQFVRASFIGYAIFSLFLANCICRKVSAFYAEEKFLNCALLMFAFFCLCMPGVGKMQTAGLFFMASAVFLEFRYASSFFREARNRVLPLFPSRQTAEKYLLFILVLLSVLALAALLPGNRIKTIDGDLMEAALWARGNTSEKDFFITHPSRAEGFRHWSKRPQTPDWKDGGIANYDYGYAVKFLEVMKLYGLKPGMREADQFNSILPEDIVRVGSLLGVRYALVPSEKGFNDRRTVFSNGKWSIVDLQKNITESGIGANGK